LAAYQCGDVGRYFYHQCQGLDVLWEQAERSLATVCMSAWHVVCQLRIMSLSLMKSQRTSRACPVAFKFISLCMHSRLAFPGVSTDDQHYSIYTP
jgi:hypothetical protein